MLIGRSRFPQIFEPLFADENKDPGAEGDEVQQENGRPEIHSKSQKTIDDQINREQKHADIFSDFHAVDLVDCFAR
jgi:hypothetical protein